MRGDNFETVAVQLASEVCEISDARWLERFVLEVRAFLDPEIEPDDETAEDLLVEYDEYRARRNPTPRGVKIGQSVKA